MTKIIIEKDRNRIRLGSSGTMFITLKENDEITIVTRKGSIKGKVLSRNSRGIDLLSENGNKKTIHFDHSEVLDVIIDSDSPAGKLIKRAVELNVSSNYWF